MKEKFTVWVGGVEVNDYLLSKEKAEMLADEYKENGYDDVIVEEVKKLLLSVEGESNER